MRREEAEILRDIAESSECIGTVAPRGKGKSWALQFITEIAVATGMWDVIVSDTKKDDVMVDTPAWGWQKAKLGVYDLEPRGWRAKFYTFNFPYGFRMLPLKYELAPVPLGSVGVAHLKFLKHVLTTADWRTLESAFWRAKVEAAPRGGEVTVEDILRWVVRLSKRRKVSETLLALLTSGYFDVHSPLEPENLVEEARKHDFVVLGGNWFKPDVMPLAWLGLLVVLDSLASYLATTPRAHRLIILFRELGQVAKRSGKVGVGWYLAEHIVSFVQKARQLGASITRVFWEAQSTKDVDPRILENTKILLIHPETLKLGRVERDLRDYFPIPERLKRKVAGMVDAPPGYMFLLRRDGTFEDLGVLPPPLSARVIEVYDEKAAERIAEEVFSRLPTYDLSELQGRALRRMQEWLGRIELEAEEEEELPIMEPTVVDLRKMRQSIASALFVIRQLIPPDGGNGEKVLLKRHTLYSWVYNAAGGVKNITFPLHPSKLESALKKGRPFLRYAGVEVGRAQDGDYVFAVDPERFNAVWPEYEKWVKEKIPPLWRSSLLEVVDR